MTNSPNFSLQVSDETMRNLFLDAMENDDTEAFKKIIAGGGDPLKRIPLQQSNPRNLTYSEADSLLYQAIHQGKFLVAILLIDLGDDPNFIGVSGYSPMARWAQIANGLSSFDPEKIKNWSVVGWGMLQQGGDTTLGNNGGPAASAQDIAKKNDLVQMVLARWHSLEEEYALDENTAAAKKNKKSIRL